MNKIRDERIIEIRRRICYNQTVYDDIRLEAAEYVGLTLEVQDLVTMGGPTTANTEVDIEHTVIRIIDNDGKFIVELSCMHIDFLLQLVVCTCPVKALIMYIHTVLEVYIWYT